MPDGLTVRANSFRMPGLWLDQVPLTVELEQGDFSVTGTANPNTFLRYGGKLTISGTGDNQVLFDPQPQGVLVLQGAGLDVSGAGSLSFGGLMALGTTGNPESRVDIRDTKQVTYSATQYVSQSDYSVNAQDVRVSAQVQTPTSYETGGFLVLAGSDVTIDAGAFSLDVLYAPENCTPACNYSAATAFFGLLSEGQLTLKTASDARYQMNMDIGFTSMPLDSAGSISGLARSSNTDVVVAAVRGPAVDQRAALDISNAGANTFSLYDLKSGTVSNVRRGFLASVLGASYGSLTVSGRENRIGFESTAATGTPLYNPSAWYVFMDGLETHNRGSIRLTATGGSNSVFLDRPASYVHGVSSSPFGGESLIEMLAPKGENVITVHPVLNAEIAASRTKLLTETTGVYVSTFASAADALAAGSITPNTVRLNAQANRIDVAGASMYVSGLLAQYRSRIELNASAGDNAISVSMAPEGERNSGYGITATNGSDVSLKASGENRIRLSPEERSSLLGKPAGAGAGLYGLYAEGSTALLEAEGNSVEVRSEVKNTYVPTVALSASNGSSLSLLAHSQGNRLVTQKDGVKTVALQIASNASKARPASDTTVRLTAQGAGDNHLAGQLAIDVNSGSVYLKTDTGVNRLYAGSEAISMGHVPVSGKPFEALVQIDGAMDLRGSSYAIYSSMRSADRGSILLNYRGSSAITGQIDVSNNSILKIAPGPEEGTMTMRSNVMVREGAQADILLTSGSLLDGMVLDNSLLGVLGEPGAMRLHLAKDARWHFENISSVATLTGEDGIVDFGTRADGLGKALYVENLTGSNRFLMRLDPDGEHGDMLFVEKAEGSGQKLVVKNAAELYSSMQVGDAVRFATILNGEDAFGSGTVLASVPLGLYTGDIVIESRDVTTDELNTNAVNIQYDGGLQVTMAKAGAPIGALYRDSLLYGSPKPAGTAREPQNVYLVLKKHEEPEAPEKTEELNGFAVGNIRAAAAGRRVLTTLDTFTKRSGQMQYMERDAEKAVWGRATYQRSNFEDAGHLSGGIFEFGRRSEASHEFTHEENVHRYRTLAAGYGEFRGRNDALTGTSKLQDFFVTYYDTREIRPGLDALEKLEPYEREQYRWHDSYARVHYLRANLNGTDPASTINDRARYHRWSFNLSTETGWKKPLSQTWSLLPQMQLAFSWISEARWKDSFGISTRADNTWSLIGRVGFDVAREWGEERNRRFYAKASLLHEFNRDSGVTLETGGQAAGLYRGEVTTRGTWGVVGAGYTHKYKRDQLFFIDAERTVGSSDMNIWSVRAGWTWLWK